MLSKLEVYNLEFFLKYLFFFLFFLKIIVLLYFPSQIVVPPTAFDSLLSFALRAARMADSPRREALLALAAVLYGNAHQAEMVFLHISNLLDFLFTLMSSIRSTEYN